ncbi:MAG TPA: GGDEF domain-containing protein [Thermoanaerobaculia bacterium]
MDILLWRWSTAVQLTSAFMIAVFFVALSKSVRRPEVVWWTRAWVANLGALLATLVFWYFSLNGIPLILVRTANLGAKITFVLLIIEGSGAVRLTTRRRLIAITTFAVLGGIFLNSIVLLGLVQHGALAILFVATAIALMRARVVIWFTAGLFVRAAIAIAEFSAYAIVGMGGSSLVHDRASTFLAASSSVDTGAEWFLALGCVLVISDRILSELRNSNSGLIAAQEDLRALADRDPLTGLANRRVLPLVFRSVQPAGATFLFFDLDGFKDINDLQGHDAGDEVLRQFAAALLASFRPDDAVVRYGGDEFVVISCGLDAQAVDERLETLRQRIPSIAFSVGASELKPGGKPEETLHVADEAMYASKPDQTLRRVRFGRRNR